MSEPTEADIERANAFFRVQASMETEGTDEEDDLALAAEFARVRAETLAAEREACAKICDALATEAQQKFQPGWLLVTNGHHEAARRIRMRVDA